MSITTLRCNRADTPLAVGPEPPRFSWRLASETRGITQARYRVAVATRPELLGPTGAGPDVWDSGEVASTAQSQGYQGPALTSRAVLYWRVDVVSGSGESARSAVARCEVGLLQPADWEAAWVTLPRPTDRHDDFRPAPHLRRSFVLPEQPARARLHVTAAGVYESFVNGQRVGVDQLSPGWTDFARRVHYQTYDVTALLQAGENVIGAVLGDGWFSGRMGPGAQRDYYGTFPSLLAQLEVTGPDGIVTRIVSDETWRGSFGALLASDLMSGEVVDARRDLGRWLEPGYADEAWPAATRTEGPTGELLGQPCTPVRVVEERPALERHEVIPGTYIYDLGQNMVGRVRIRLAGAPGTIIRLRYGEMLNPDGSLYTENLRQARCTDTYICAGGRTETWEQRFTFHGFRYVELTGCGDPPAPADLVGVVLSSAVETTGEFDCSDPLLRQLQRNIVWGQRGNFLEIPTDCPQRDERLGWTGDIQTFVGTACFNADVEAFLGKWLVDLVDAQSPEGAFPDIAPLPPHQFRDFLAKGAPAWGDAGAIVPWALYRWYGDRDILQAMFEPAAAWVDYLEKANPDHLWTANRGNDFGDWLSLGATTPKEVVATAFYSWSARLVGLMAAELGRDDQAQAYGALADRVAAAFQAAYVDGDGRILGDTQTGYVLALRFGLLTEVQHQAAVRHLVAALAASDDHLSTGFVGVAHLLPALTDGGHLDLAYQLVCTDTFPSWGYSIRQGATTMWERWDGWTESTGFQDAAMNSFNHYAFGSVGEWLYAVVGGLRCHPEVAGWEHIVVEPRPGGGLTWAQCRYVSTRGPVSCHWERAGLELKVDIEIPPGSVADIVLPCPPGGRITEGGVAVEEVSLDGASGRFRIGSGRYQFLVADR
ncbi:MAG TPA: family 78 glycoside hydrolase catalytic domain [Acidimicrobiales bacterium]|nr:family 78 glycoside hydrolase catalytic domain [Acidimicrobiales bacterium]